MLERREIQDKLYVFFLGRLQRVGARTSKSCDHKQAACVRCEELEAAEVGGSNT